MGGVGGGGMGREYGFSVCRSGKSKGIWGSTAGSLVSSFSQDVRKHRFALLEVLSVLKVVWHSRVKPSSISLMSISLFSLVQCQRER